MTDCKTASDLMMKYLDGEVDIGQENALKQHLDYCVSCQYEFKLIKETLQSLDSVEMEEAPCGLEGKVISAIKNEQRAKARKKSRFTDITICILLFALWIGLTAVLFTPAMNAVNYWYSVFSNGFNQLAGFIVNLDQMSASFLTKLLSMGKALNLLLSDFREVYTNISAALILFIAALSELHVYTRKMAGR